MQKKDINEIAKNALLEIKKEDMVIEQNVAGYRKSVAQAYPSASFLKQAFELNNIKYEYICEKEFFIHGFKNEFSQVILNLINNAKDALLENKIENPFILVSVTEDKESIVISVCDNGGGIKEDILLKIFENKKEDFKNSKLFGRLSKISENIIIDVGHNPLAANSILRALDGDKSLLI